MTKKPTETQKPNRDVIEDVSKTLEGALRAREGTVLGMDANLSYAGDKVRIIFRGVAGHDRISLLVDGDTVTVEGK